MCNKQEVAGTGSRRLSFAAAFAALAIVTLLPMGVAQAQKLVEISGSSRTAMVNVSIGKSADVRTDLSFTDVTVGDPEVADVNILTDRSLSILGRKSGTTRVTAYGEDKKLIGMFDVEVSYDTSMLAAEITRRFSHAGIRVATANGKILLTGTAPDALTLDQALTVAKQFGPDVINSVSVDAPQQVMLEVRFVEATRQASREIGVQWNVFGSSGTANIGSRQPAHRLPIDAPRNPNRLGAGEVAAGVLSGAPPFGVAVARMIAGGITTDAFLNALEEQGLARSLAEPNLTALSGDTASFLAGGEYPIPVAGSLGSVTIEYKRYGVGLAFTPTVLKGGLINLKIEPEVSQFDPSHTVSVGNGISVPALHRPPRQYHGGTARRPELRDRRVAAEQQSLPRGNSCPGLATCRCSARCSPAAPTRRARLISRSSSRRALCARRVPATSSGHRSTRRCRPTTWTSS